MRVLGPERQVLYSITKHEIAEVPMKYAQLRFHFGRKCLAIRHRLLTECFPPIQSARRESNRAHGSLERAHARPRWNDELKLVLVRREGLSMTNRRRSATTRSVPAQTPEQLLELTQEHIRPLIPLIDRLNEAGAEDELKVISRQLTRLSFRAQPLPSGK